MPNKKTPPNHHSKSVTAKAPGLVPVPEPTASASTGPQGLLDGAEITVNSVCAWACWPVELSEDRQKALKAEGWAWKADRQRDNPDGFWMKSDVYHRQYLKLRAVS